MVSAGLMVLVRFCGRGLLLSCAGFQLESFLGKVPTLARVTPIGPDQPPQCPWPVAAGSSWGCCSWESSGASPFPAVRRGRKP